MSLPNKEEMRPIKQKCQKIIWMFALFRSHKSKNVIKKFMQLTIKGEIAKVDVFFEHRKVRLNIQHNRKMEVKYISFINTAAEKRNYMVNVILAAVPSH